MDWATASKKAMAILGPKGKIPEPEPAVIKSTKTNRESWDQFVKCRNALRALVTKHQNNFEKVLGAVTANQDDINKDSLGLDPKNKDDLKKIVQARKLLSDAIGEALKKNQAKFAELKGLDKFVDPILAYDE